MEYVNGFSNTAEVTLEERLRTFYYETKGKKAAINLRKLNAKRYEEKEISSLASMEGTYWKGKHIRKPMYIYIAKIQNKESVLKCFEEMKKEFLLIGWKNVNEFVKYYSFNKYAAKALMSGSFRDYMREMIAERAIAYGLVVEIYDNIDVYACGRVRMTDIWMMKLPSSMENEFERIEKGEFIEYMNRAKEYVKQMSEDFSLKDQKSE